MVAAGLTVLAALTTSAPAAEAGRSSPSSAVVAGPRIEFPVPHHDFGSIPKGQTARHAFTVTNTGSVPLEILDVKPACGCTTANTWPHRLEPGASGSIPVQFETVQFTGAVTKTLTVTSNDPARPTVVLEFTASIWAPIAVSQSVVIFPAAAEPDQPASRTITLRHQAEGQLVLSGLASDQPVFRPSLRAVIPGREFELTIATVPPLATGTQTGRITLRTSNPAMPEIVVQAIVTVLPAVQFAPSAIVLSSAKLIAAEKKYVVVLNHRGGDLKLSDLQMNLDGVDVSAPASTDGRQFTVTLTFPAGFESRATPAMRFRGRTSHPDFPAFEIPITYAGSR